MNILLILLQADSLAHNVAKGDVQSTLLSWIEVLGVFLTVASTAYGVYMTWRVKKIEKKNQLEIDSQNAQIEKLKVQNESKKIDSEVGSVTIDKLIELQAKENAQLRQKITHLEEISQIDRKSLQTLTNEIQNLKIKLFIIDKLEDDSFSFPKWKKDTKGRILKVNDKYVKRYYEPANINPLDAIGKTDTELWGDEIGRNWRKGDSYVYLNKETYIGIEKTVVNEESIFEMVVKIPIIVDEIVEYSEGFTIPINKPIVYAFLEALEIPKCDIIEEKF